MTSSQVEVGGTFRPRVTFSSGGTPVNLDSGVPTVAVTRPDGTAITSPAPVAAKVAATTGIYEIANLAALTVPTLLRIDWAGVIGSAVQTQTTWVEVVGEFLFGLAAAKAWDGGALVAAGVSDDAILDMRASLTDDLEQAHRCNVSFVPRHTREVHDGGGGDILLHHQRATTLLSVTVNGIAQQLAGYTLTSSGILRATSNYTAGTPIRAGIGNVTVEYVRGYPQAPGPVSMAALRITRALLVPSNIGDRATSITNDAGTILLATAGRGQYQPYGIPLADSVLAAYAEPLAA